MEKGKRGLWLTSRARAIPERIHAISRLLFSGGNRKFPSLFGWVDTQLCCCNTEPWNSLTGKVPRRERESKRNFPKRSWSRKSIFLVGDEELILLDLVLIKDFTLIKWGSRATSVHLQLSPSLSLRSTIINSFLDVRKILPRLLLVLTFFLQTINSTKVE